MRSVLKYLVVVALGAAVAIVGAVGYRSAPWWGVALSIALVLVAALFSRAWLGWGGLVAWVTPWMILTFLFAQTGPGGDTLIAADALGYAWLIGATVMVLVVALIPPSLVGSARRVAGA